MSRREPDVHDAVVSWVGGFLLAFEPPRVAAIDEAASAGRTADSGVFDAADLLGLDPGSQGPEGGPRRRLTLAGGQRTIRLVVGSTVELVRFASDALCAPPPFLDDLWRRLCVRTLIRRRRGAAFLIDADALLARTAGRGGESTPGGES